MERFVERLAAFFATNVVLVYLGGMFLGTLVYFTQASFGISTSLELTVGVCLAFAVEVHSFLEQRQTRRLYQLWSHLEPDSEPRAAAWTQVIIHLGLTAGLVAFSMFNAIAYWALTTHPQTSADWVQVVIRGIVIPAFFLAAGFLTPLHHDATDTLDQAAASILSKTVKVTIKQWHKRVQQNAKQGVDLAPVVIALLHKQGDAGAAERVSLIAAQLDVAERKATRRGDSFPHVPDLTPLPYPPQSLQAQPAMQGTTSPTVQYVGSVLEAPSTATATDPAASTATLDNPTPEQKCRMHYTPGMTAGALRRASGVSKTSANKYWRVLAAEHGITLPPAGHRPVKKVAKTATPKTAQAPSQAVGATV